MLENLDELSITFCFLVNAVLVSSVVGRWRTCISSVVCTMNMSTRSSFAPSIQLLNGYNISSPHSILTQLARCSSQISEGAAPCPYCLVPCPNSLAPCPIYIAPCPNLKTCNFRLCFQTANDLQICAHVFIDRLQNCFIRVLDCAWILAVRA